MVQLKNPIHNIKKPYELKSQIRITNCLFARFTEKEENLQFAYQKLGVYAFENDIKLKGDSYTVFVKLEEENIVADVQLEQVNSQVDTYNNRIQLLIKAKENATNGTNKFNKDEAVERKFYNRLNAAYYAGKAFYVDKKALKDQGYDEKQIEEFVKTQKDKSDEQYFKTISEFTSERNQYELEVSKLIAQKCALENSKEQNEYNGLKITK